MQELIFSPEGGKPIVFVDDREQSNECVARLKHLGAELKVQRLGVADFIVSQRVGVERKECGDLESSVVDGRLFRQAEELKQNFERPLIAVVGKGFCRLNEKALEGALIALTVDYGIPVLFFEDEVALGNFLFHLAGREQLSSPKERRLRLEKKAFSVGDQQRFIVESLPGIGPSTAKKLLEHFGSVEGVFEAHEDELAEVAGIGKDKAAEIRRVVAASFARK
ncbi:hypothetical protein H0O03_02525 [Candidatus Micrarchaeota archaeon]|nr:hypothetical protein [Candidatus Micrarchaeota archaeon]